MLYRNGGGMEDGISCLSTSRKINIARDTKTAG